MKALALCLWLSAAIAASAQTNRTWELYRFPTRVLGPGAVVNLQPLYDWWGRQPTHAGGAEYETASLVTDTNNPPPPGFDRPLTAWHLVTGIHLSTVGNSWLVNAVIYTSPTTRTNTRIILNHPPMAEEQQYYTLKSELVQITNDAHAYQSDVKAEQDDQKRENSALREKNRKAAANDANNYAQLASANQADAASIATDQKQLEAARPQIEEHLKSIPALNGVYYVDWFAAMVGFNKQGMPVYDMGRVAASPP